MTWTLERRHRYAMHVLLPDIGGRGQDRLAGARAVVDVDGRAGQICAVYLAAGGVGTIALVGGTQRPTGFPCAGGDHVAAAIADALRARNPEVAVVPAAPDERAIAIVDDRRDLPLATALARGGAVAARWMHAHAVAEDP